MRLFWPGTKFHGDMGGMPGWRELPRPDSGLDRRYLQPYPLSEDYHIVGTEGKILLIDRFRNEILLHDAESVAGLDAKGRVYPVQFAQPIMARRKPSMPATQTYQGERRALPHQRATISVVNVYESDFQWPPNTVITHLRIVQIVTKPFSYRKRKDNPPIGGDGAIARLVLGTVPVEVDGSAYFEAPVEREIYFQALDSTGMAVMGMRSATYVHPGEQMSCVGCHEDKWKVPPANLNTLAFRRAPSKITPEPDGSCPLSYSRLVRLPVFERKCTPCHQKEGKGIAFQYTGSYGEMQKYLKWYNASGTGGSASSTWRTEIGKFGARASTFTDYLYPSHHGVELTAEERRRVIVWIDNNSVNLSSYNPDRDVVARQNAGGVVWPVVWPGLDVVPWNPRGVDILTADNTPPSTPTGVTAASSMPYPFPVSLSWQASRESESEVGCYTVYRNGESIAQVVSTRFVDYLVVPDTTYSYQISATNVSGAESPRSQSVNVTVQSDRTAPSAVSGLAAAPVGANPSPVTFCLLSWSGAEDPESGIRRYNVYRGGDARGTVSQPSFIDTGLAEATSYTWEVAAVNNSGMEGPRTAVSATTPSDTVKPVLLSCHCAGVEPGGLRLVFNEPVDPVSAVNTANYSLSGVTVTSATPDSARPTRVLLTTSGLRAGTSYTLTVGGLRDRARNPNTMLEVSVAFVTRKESIVFTYEYYELAARVSQVPDFTGLTPKTTGTTALCNTSVAQRSSDYALRFTGQISAVTAGEYTFYTNSDDGSRLYVDGSLVVDNDGDHGPVEKSGTVNLTAGDHSLAVTMYQGGGGAVLAVSWAGPGFAKQLISGDTAACWQSPTVPVSVAWRPQVIEGRHTTPTSFKFVGAYPNPFSGTLQVRIAVPRTAGEQAEANGLVITLCTLDGRRVRRLHLDRPAPGLTAMTITAVSEQGQRLLPGVYLCSVRLGGEETARVVVKGP